MSTVQPSRRGPEVMSEQITTKRLHIGGLGANITPENLRERFQSFGNVIGVESLEPDALGQPRRFAYLTLETTSGQLRKCLNVMSGSTWRGSHLRIAEAKPRYQVKLEKERNESQEEIQLRLRKRKQKMLKISLAQGIGKEDQDMRLVDQRTYAHHKFWKITPDGRLIRPLAMRPSHPFPIPQAPQSGPTRRAPSRASRRVIDPTAWSSKCLSGIELGGEVEYPSGGAEWQFVPEDLDALAVDGDGRAAIGSWRRVINGEEESEVVHTRIQPLVSEEEGLEMLEGPEDDDSGSDLFGHHKRPEEDVGVTSRGSSPLFGRREEPREDIGAISQDSSPLFGSRDELRGEPVSTSRESSPLFGHLLPDQSTHQPDDQAAPTEKQSTPTPWISQHPDKAVLPIAGPSKVSRPQHDYNPELRRQYETEIKRDLSILDSVLGESNVQASGSKPTRLWFEESDSDEGEDVAPLKQTRTTNVLRLRGGGPTSDTDDVSDDDEESSDEDDSSDSSDTTSDDSSDDSEDDSESSHSGNGSDKGETSILSKAVPSQESKPKSSLKDMFASSSGGGGFSLMADLGGDIEMDEALDIPVPSHTTPTAHQEELAAEPLLASSRAIFVPDPSESLFFPVFPPLPDGNGRTKDPLSEYTSKDESKGFWAQETDQEMKAIWERDKLELTREWKRKHREAKKHRRRKGGELNDLE